MEDQSNADNTGTSRAEEHTGMGPDTGVCLESSTDTPKISHYIASSGLNSRRKAEILVRSGQITVNDGLVTEVAYRVQPGDVVKYLGKTLRPIDTPKLYGYHKPIESLVTHEIYENRINVFQLVKNRIGRVLSVGRLDYMSEGLLLLTNSNKLCSQLMHSNVERIYKVCLDSIPADLDRVTRPFTLDGIDYLPWKILKINGTWVTLVLNEGKNREIRRAFDAFGSSVRRLVRIKYGDFVLKGQPNDLWELDAKGCI